MDKGLAYGGGVELVGSAAPFSINAKNLFGAYTGRKALVALIRDRVVVKVGEPDNFPLLLSYSDEDPL